jgi:uncharacterized membrane protein YgdD (TMEM256/DUF423 family)
MQRIWIALGSLAGLGTVAMAAVAAHGLRQFDPAAVRMVGSAIQMQGWHALALLAAGLWSRQGGPLAHAAALTFAIGTMLFCGAVYTQGLTGSSLGLVAPTGGVILMLGWLLLGLSAVRNGSMTETAA